MQQTTRAAQPATPITDPSFAYVSSAATDITATLKRFGWTEPDRERQRATKRRLNPIDETGLGEQLVDARL